MYNEKSFIRILRVETRIVSHAESGYARSKNTHIRKKSDSCVHKGSIVVLAESLFFFPMRSRVVKYGSHSFLFIWVFFSCVQATWPGMILKYRLWPIQNFTVLASQWLITVLRVSHDEDNYYNRKLKGKWKKKHK